MTIGETKSLDAGIGFGFGVGVGEGETGRLFVLLLPRCKRQRRGFYCEVSKLVIIMLGTLSLVPIHPASGPFLSPYSITGTVRFRHTAVSFNHGTVHNAGCVTLRLYTAHDIDTRA